LSFAGRIAVAPDRQLFVRDEGGDAARTPVLLLHGFTGCGETMRVAAQALPGRRQLFVDLPGHGESDAPHNVNDYAMECCTRDLLAVLDARGVARAHLLGYSLGARVALGLALAAPQRAASLLLVGARAGLADAAARSARRRADEQLADDILARGMEWFADYWMALPLFQSQRRLGAEFLAAARAQRLRNRPEGLANSLRGIGLGAQPPLAELLAKLEVPALFITGALDPRFGEAADELARRMPRACRAVLPQAGHAAHLENPRAFARALRRFLAAVEAK